MVASTTVECDAVYDVCDKYAESWISYNDIMFAAVAHLLCRLCHLFLFLLLPTHPPGFDLTC
jgi:hypothetical protein